MRHEKAPIGKSPLPNFAWLPHLTFFAPWAMPPGGPAPALSFWLKTAATALLLAWPTMSWQGRKNYQTNYTFVTQHIPKYKTIKEHLQHFFDLCLLQRLNLAKTSLSRLCIIASNPLGLHGMIEHLCCIRSKVLHTCQNQFGNWGNKKLWERVRISIQIVSKLQSNVFCYI